jgi:hypothetical protein
MPFFRKKPKPVAAPSTPVVAPGFRQPTGRLYLDVLEDLHGKLKPDWYLEIGTQKGKSLARASCRSIAIDPEFKIAVDAFKALPQLHMFSATSDDFFATSFLQDNAIRIDFAFLDGMHLFEYLLRDFINTERAASPGACITAHDCVPLNPLMAQRDWDKAVTRQWTGDVWKLLPILQKYRPGLAVAVLDCAPTGLVAITNLDPSNDVLSQNLEAIIAEWTPVSLTDYGLERFGSQFPLVPEASYLGRL